MREIERIIGKKFIAGEMPTGKQICEKQLLKVIDDLEKVKVNEEEIADFMTDIYRKLDWLSSCFSHICLPVGISPAMNFLPMMRSISRILPFSRRLMMAMEVPVL